MEKKGVFVFLLMPTIVVRSIQYCCVFVLVFGIINITKTNNCYYGTIYTKDKTINDDIKKGNKNFPM